MDKPDALRLVDVPLALRDNLWHTQAEHVLLKLQANNNQLSAQRDALLEALKKADHFITNGIELGFIRMPDADTPDTAHETPGIVRAAIKAVEEAG